MNHEIPIDSGTLILEMESELLRLTSENLRLRAALRTVQNAERQTESGFSEAGPVSGDGET